MSDTKSKPADPAQPVGPPPFRISSLWEPAQVNPLNLKSYSIPLFNLKSPYARNFHLCVWNVFLDIVSAF
jgi:MFS transporter, NNP family, nitrate/nitrite transporter